VGFTNHIWAVGVIGQKKVKLRGLDNCLDNVPCKMCQFAVLLKDKIIICNVFGSYYHFVEMVERLSNAIH